MTASTVVESKTQSTTVSTPSSWLVTPEDDQRTPVISVVMPTLNEEGGIGECIDQIITALETLELPGEVIVSDSSTDRTPEIAREMGAHVVVPDKAGYGYAYQYAFEEARGEYIVIGDADTTYDFTSIPDLLEPVRNGDADITMGTRLEGEIKDGAMPALHQYVGNPMLTKFLNIFYDAGVTDAHSGFRVLHRDALDAMDLESTGMEFASEMVMEAGARGLEIKERPIVYHEREGDATLDSFRDGWRHMRFMLQNAPSYLFTYPGSLLILVGLFVLGIAIGGLDIAGVTLGPNSMIAGSLLTIVGYQVGSMGTFAHVGGDPIQTPSDPIATWFIEQSSLERAGTAGLLLFVFGGTYAASLVWLWINSGFERVPMMAANIIAFTAIVIGLQTIFGAFLLSVIAENRE